MAAVNTIYPPEIWAMESLNVLRDQLVMARLVHRNFESDVAQRGDTVKTRKPVKLTARDWTGQSQTTGLANDETSVELLNANELDILLDTLKYTSFLVEDRDAAISIKDLREEFIVPAIDPIAQAVDDDIMSEFCGQSSSDFASNPVGVVAAGATHAGTAMDDGDIVAARKAMNVNQCPFDGRNIVLSTQHESDCLNTAIFVQADQSGSTDALTNANLGRKFGFDIYMSQNVPLWVPDTTNPTATLNQSLAFHRNALALVTRPLAAVGGGLGAVSATQSLDGVGIRVTSSYESRYKGVVMSFDCLYGVQLLDENFAAIICP